MLKEDIKSLFYYDDGKLFNKISRGKALKDTEAGSIIFMLNAGYRIVQVKNKKHLIHRLVWVMFNQPIENGLEIDHINGDTMDNRIENLRCVERLINMRNRNKRKDNSSGVTGVCWDSESKKWLVQVTDIDGKRRKWRFDDIDKAEEKANTFRASNGYTERHGV